MMKWLTQNFGIKVISLILAIGLWYYAVGEEGIEVTRIIPLELKVQNSQMSILKTSARAVQVTFVAPRALLSELTSEDIQAFHEIGSEVNKAGEYSFRLEPREIKMKMPQIRITKIEPETILVTLDELIVQKLAIQPQFIGEPAFGYKLELKGIELNPNAVLIEGAKGELEKLDSVKTEKLNLVGRTRSFRTAAELALPPNLKLLGENVVDIYIPISEEYEEKPFENIEVRILRAVNTSDKIEIDPKTVSFSLAGSKKNLEKVLPENVQPYVDLSTLEPGTHEVLLELMLPEKISLKGDPIRIKATIKK